jgi:V8-like Glu-specific endopeptidase
VVDATQRAKVMIVGHPKGGDLSFSVSDNEVVDHELDDDPRDRPRRIHYRTPTEPGSSGSPVFHHKSLEVVGLHRTGRAKPLRDDWPRAREDEIYEANEAVSMRSLLGL